ncbi:DUF5946 family protein [Nonomuraea sp. ATR24]|uniref:DUF5946 family protein n=1 Tax=unclassified Nonomuraea TaxID=2593643 RepID=UPI0033CB0C72
MDQCDCGAEAGPLGLCEDYYYAILAEEQGDPEMYRWHAPVVCAYLLQHPSRGHAKYLDTQFRLLQLCLDQGIEALLRVASHQVARNRHGVRSGYDMAPLEPYAPLPQEGPPERFRTGFAALPCDDGSFVARGHEDYGRRMTAIAQATVDAWFGRPAG